MTINRQYPIVHSDTVLATGTKKLTFEQPESFVDFSDGNETGVRFHLDIHGTTGTFDSFKVTCKFQIGMIDVNGAGFSQFRWYDLQPEQIKTMVQEGVDWYGGTVAPGNITNLMTNPSWETAGTGYLDVAGTGGAVTPSRPTDGAFLGTTRRRTTWTAPSTGFTAGHVWGDNSINVTAGRTYTGALRFAASKANRYRIGLRWYSDTSTTALSTDYGESKIYPATTIQNGHRPTVTAVAPAGASHARLYLHTPEGEGASNPAAGDWVEVDAGMLVEGDYLPPDFDGDSPNAVWNGTPHASTSTLAINTTREPNVVATNKDTLPVTVSRSIKGFGQLVRVQVKPVFVNGSADAGITYSLLATH